MPKGNRGAFFAIGLVLGVAISMFFLIWSFPGFRYPTYQQERYQDTNNRETGENNPVIRPSIWETYTSPTDTYAQWAMAGLSIVANGVSLWAVWLLKGSLKATRDAVDSAICGVEVAREANDLATKQFRLGFKPWIIVEAFGPFVIMEGTVNPIRMFTAGEKTRPAGVGATVKVSSIGEMPPL